MNNRPAAKNFTYWMNSYAKYFDGITSNGKDCGTRAQTLQKKKETKNENNMFGSYYHIYAHTQTEGGMNTCLSLLYGPHMNTKLDRFTDKGANIRTHTRTDGHSVWASWNGAHFDGMIMVFWVLLLSDRFFVNVCVCVCVLLSPLLLFSYRYRVHFCNSNMMVMTTTIVGTRRIRCWMAQAIAATEARSI